MSVVGGFRMSGRGWCRVNEVRDLPRVNHYLALVYKSVQFDFL
jgi:hypothetical protein